MKTSAQLARQRVWLPVSRGTLFIVQAIRPVFMTIIMTAIRCSPRSGELRTRSSGAVPSKLSRSLDQKEMNVALMQPMRDE